MSYLFPEVLDSIKYIFFLVYLAKGDKILSKYFAMRRLISSEMSVRLCSEDFRT